MPKQDSDLIIIKDGEGEIPLGKRPVPFLDSLQPFNISEKSQGGLEKEVLANKPNDSAEVCIVKTGRTYTLSFTKANVTVKYISYAALYCGLEDDPDYKEQLREDVQAHHGS